MAAPILVGTFILFVISAFFSWSVGLVFGALFLLGIYDVLQRKHTILRNFPIIGHLRYALESLRPEIQQYFIESDSNGAPLPRITREAVYKKSKQVLETVPFGSELDMYADNYRWINHSCFPSTVSEKEFRVRIGGEHCTQPYEASLFNISAMSFGSLGYAALRALGNGARAGNFFHNTGEGGLSPYHLETGADIVWQLGTAYFGARDNEGKFDPVAFAETAKLPQVKMIEIKISQGAKPGHGGILPGQKVTPEIAKIRRVAVRKTVKSPPGHSAFSTPKELCYFIQKLRDLSGGKPVGIKFCLGRRDDFIHICEAMVVTNLCPDFITVDGGEGGTGAAPFDFINYVGSPLDEALYFVDDQLRERGLRDKVKIIASGKVMTGFDIFEKLALGADLCNSARGMMLALGCIQAYRCNTNSCPAGITTSDAGLQRGLDVKDKSERVKNFHQKTIEAFSELLAATGLTHPDQVELKHISCRFQDRILTLEEVHRFTSELTEHEEKAKSIIPKSFTQEVTPVEDF